MNDTLQSLAGTKTVSLEGLDYAALTAVAAEASAKANQQRAPFLENLRQQIRSMCGNAGVTVSELFQAEAWGPPPAPARKVRAKSTAAPKYRSPAGETWTGRGKRPNWLKEAITAGSKVEDFRIMEG